EDQTDRLISLSRELHLDRSVNFVGSVDDQQLLDYYAAANVFALPSSSEAQGIVALEAMACGLPVVASAVGGLLGTIHDGHTGFLVAPGAASQPLAGCTEAAPAAVRACDPGRARSHPTPAEAHQLRPRPTQSASPLAGRPGERQVRRVEPGRPSRAQRAANHRPPRGLRTGA